MGQGNKGDNIEGLIEDQRRRAEAAGVTASKQKSHRAQAYLDARALHGDGTDPPRPLNELALSREEFERAVLSDAYGEHTGLATYPAPDKGGLKFDGGKPRWDLVQLDVFEEVAAILEFGARKYEANSWQTVAGAEGRYLAALLRHITAYQRGEELDAESGLPHLAHAACNLMFLRWFQQQPKPLPTTDTLTEDE